MGVGGSTPWGLGAAPQGAWVYPPVSCTLQYIVRKASCNDIPGAIGILNSIVEYSDW